MRVPRSLDSHEMVARISATSTSVSRTGPRFTGITANGRPKIAANTATNAQNGLTRAATKAPTPNIATVTYSGEPNATAAPKNRPTKAASPIGLRNLRIR